MIKIDIEDRENWNKIIKGFENWDVYYLNEYAKSLQIHGDGSPFLLYWEEENQKMAYVVMENDIAEFAPFVNNIPQNRYYDWTTPYGYGGPLLNNGATEEFVRKNIEDTIRYAKEHKIVSSFFRYHPLMQNHKSVEKFVKVIHEKQTVYVDTSSVDTIWRNMTPNNRNMVRKAEKNGITIVADQGEKIEEFIKIYDATMKKNNADEYYYFKKEYFEYLMEHLQDNCIFFYALYEEKIISASIFLFNEKYMHYHLSGTLAEYNKLGATNMLLTKAAEWAAERGIEKFHLGGGVDNEDSLLRFKKHFNRYGLIDFCIGAEIFLEDDFRQLVEIRKNTDPTYDVNRPFLIKYRG